MVDIYCNSYWNSKNMFSGIVIGNLVARLNKMRNFPLSKFHLLGHSLGAHIMGYAGKQVKEITGSKVQRITGMDPAGPLFEVPMQPPTKRLSHSDADVVEVVHTDGGLAGFVSPIGDIDFYPNGGLFIQPNCINKKDLSQIADGSNKNLFKGYNRAIKAFFFLVTCHMSHEKRRILYLRLA